MMALIFTIVLVVITLTGSLWVMYHLNTNMMPATTCPDDSAAKRIGASDDGSGAGPARARRRIAVIAIALRLLAVVGLIALGIWQVERRAWKLDLIERVDAARPRRAGRRARPRATWPAINAANDEYRRVTRHGRFLQRSRDAACRPSPSRRAATGC